MFYSIYQTKFFLLRSYHILHKFDSVFKYKKDLQKPQAKINFFRFFQNSYHSRKLHPTEPCRFILIYLIFMTFLYQIIDQLTTRVQHFVIVWVVTMFNIYIICREYKHLCNTTDHMILVGIGDFENTIDQRLSISKKTHLMFTAPSSSEIILLFSVYPTLAETKEDIII